MKTVTKINLFLLLCMSAMSCKDQIEDTYIVNEPIYMGYTELREAFDVLPPEDIIQPGKLYFKDHYIFVNEYQKGIHVVDNSNPESPVVLKFIEIPGNVDLAIKDNILYADSYVDLLAIDISDLNSIREVKRIKDAFPYITPEIKDGIVSNLDQSQGVVTGWKQVERTEKVSSQQIQWQQFPTWREGDMLVNNSGSKNNNGTGGFGTGGSMARFTLYANYLYAVDISSLHIFDVTEPSDPDGIQNLSIGWNIETIFPYNDKLFIGSQTGMMIYSLQDPENPSYISSFWHASSCDPVVVEGNYAYVTLRAGNLCGDILSQLDVIDISDITNPTLLKEYPMTEPYGLGIDDSILFVCDGNAGLKIYNASDPLLISSNELAMYPEVNAFDVIPLDGNLLMIGRDGLYQYDYSDIENIRQLSFIPIYSHLE